MNQAGNGISVWNAPGGKVLEQRHPVRARWDLRHRQQELICSRATTSVISGSRCTTCIPMTARSAHVSTNNTVGFAIMYSHRLTVRGNVSDGDRDRGLLFNFANGSEISGNVVHGRLQSAARWASPGMRGAESQSTVCPRPKRSNRSHPRAARASAPRSACLSITPTRTNSATTGSRVAKLASISRRAGRE